MTNTITRNRIPRRPCALLAGVFVVLAVVTGSAAAYQPAETDDHVRDVDPALGINDTFGRWNTTVNLVYDPDDAPAPYQSIGEFLALLEAATQQWERVSGINFEVLPADPDVPDDSGRVAAQQDGLVRVHWAPIGGAAGQAAPEFGNYDNNLGYFPYYDGRVTLNDDAAIWDGGGDMLATLVHELGHLIGLGHSDNPRSVVYANPYNFLRYPREDDIRAVQVLYGKPAVDVDPASPVPEWLYHAPDVVAPAAATLANSFLSLNLQRGTPVNSVNDSAAEDQYLLFNSGNFSGAVALDTRLIVVDPGGYVWRELEWSLICPAFSVCSNYQGIIRVAELRTYPGLWKILLIDESQGAASPRLLRSHSVTVTSATTYNEAPRATVTASDGGGPARVTFTLAATDKEHDAIEVIWHPPGPRQDRDGNGFLDNELAEMLGSDGTAVQTVNFFQTGTHTMFVELRDDSARYTGNRPGGSNAGGGFSNVLRLVVTLPLTAPGGGVEVHAMWPASEPATGLTSAVISAIGGAEELTNIVAHNQGVSNARFRMGASRDLGNSTATSFTSSDSVVLAGTVLPLPADVGKAADIFIVVRALIGGTDLWLYRDPNGAFKVWNNRVPDLLPAYHSNNLPASSAWLVYNGALPAGEYRAFIGYRAAGSDTLHYNGNGLPLTVAP